MKFIAHRGNVNGPEPSNENRPKYLEEALNLGYDVEFDIWKVEESFFLGHNEPIFEVSLEWLSKIRYKSWVHCKNFEALFELKRSFNVFWHSNEDYVLTGFGYIWAFPEKEKSGCICVQPELPDRKVLVGASGICSNYIKKYKDLFS